LRIFLKYNLWAILWGLFIILLLTLPGKVFPKLPVFIDLFQPDKLVHLFIFGVYAVLQIRGFRMQDTFPGAKKHAVLITLIIGFILGAGTELLQHYWIPMRTGSIYDLLSDMAGCFLGWLVAGKLKIKN